MAEAQRQWSGRTHGGTFGQWFLVGLLRRVGVRWVYPVLYVAIPFYLLFGRKGRKEMMRYFRQVRGEKPLRALWSTARNHMIFGRVVLDRFAALAGRTDQFSYTVEGQEHFERCLNSEKACLMVGSHIGNLELVGHCLKQERKPVMGFAFGGENANLQQMRSSSLERTNVRMAPIGQDMSHILALNEALENGEVIVAAGDRSMGPTATHEVTMLGRPTELPVTLFKLAARRKANVIALFALKGKGTHYRVIVKEIAIEESPSMGEMMQRYADAISQVLNEEPLQWFNYFNFWKL